VFLTVPSASPPVMLSQDFDVMSRFRKARQSYSCFGRCVWGNIPSFCFI